MAKRNTGRRGHSRKRRPTPQVAHDSAPRAAPVARPAQHSPRALGESKAAAGERPQAPWHPLPLSELLIFAGMIGALVAFLRGVEGNAALLGAGIAAVAIGTIEVALREHLGGFRSHTLMLAVIPAVVFHSLVVLVVLAVAGRAPRWLNIALLPLDVALVIVCFRLLRARYLDARRERTFAGLR